MGRRVRRSTVLVMVTVLVMAMGSFTAVRAGRSGGKATLRNAGGAVVGVVEFAERDGAVEVEVKGVQGLPAGFHGFHVHAVGTCDPATGFASAGGHFSADGAHPGHAGDMPVLLINADGTGGAVFRTDRFSVPGVVGRAVIVHALPDNYANVPVGTGSTQYTANAADASALTAATGNAGGRIACGVIEED